MKDDFLWVEKYRPKTVDDTILPDELKKTFQTFVNDENVPNLLLTSSSITKLNTRSSSLATFIPSLAP